MFGDSRFLSCGADSTITPIFAGGLAPVEFAIREQTGIGRDDGSTKLKHQSAVEIESENLAVRFTPFWPKLRLSMSIGKTSKHSGNRRPADVSDGAHHAGAVPGRPLGEIGLHSHPDQGSYARHLRVALLRRRRPKDCQPQLSTRRSRRSSAWGDTAAGERLRHPRIIKPQVTRPETGIPRHIQHDIQDAKGDGKGSSARLAQPRRLTGAWRHNFMAEYAFEK